MSDKQNLFSTLNAFESKEITEVQNAHLKMLLKDGEKQTSRCKTLKSSKMRLEDPEAGRFLAPVVQRADNFIQWIGLSTG